MMQELQTIGTPDASSKGTVTGRSFAVLLALAGSDSTNTRALGNRLGLTRDECRSLIDDLQKQYLVDVVSRLDGRAVKETLRLTDEGEATLVRSLEQMCELPESS